MEIDLVKRLVKSDQYDFRIRPSFPSMYTSYIQWSLTIASDVPFTFILDFKCLYRLIWF